MALENVLRAIEDIKNGKMVVMVDDEDRENEGDLVFSAASSDMQKVNFAITHGSQKHIEPRDSFYSHDRRKGCNNGRERIRARYDDQACS